MTRSTLLTRALLAGGLSLTALTLAGGTASAASAALSYSCDYGVGDVEGTGDATATWDTAITDGLVVPVGTQVDLDPYTGTVDLPDGFVDELRAQEATELSGGGLHLTFLDETGEPIVIELVFAATAVPEVGPMTLELTGVDAGFLDAVDPGPYTIVADDFLLVTDDESSGMYCILTDEGDPTIDAFTAVAPSPSATATPTTSTPAASPTAVRPVLVQTDAVDASRGSSTGLVGGALLAGSIVVGGLVAGRRASSRRH